MDTKRLIVFIALSMMIMVAWQFWFAPPPPVPGTHSATSASATPVPVATTSNAVETGLQQGERTVVETDLLQVGIDSFGGDLRSLKLRQHGELHDPREPFTLFTQDATHIYVAQTGLLSAAATLPNHRTRFAVLPGKTRLEAGQDTLEVRLQVSEAGVQVNKIYVFHRGSYRIDVRYEVKNTGSSALPLEAYFRLLRDASAPEGSQGGYFGVNTFFGPAVYSEEDKYRKVSFSDLDKYAQNPAKKPDHPDSVRDGWVAMVQHYFVTAWVLSPQVEGKDVSVCGTPCRIEMQRTSTGLYSVGAVVPLGTLAPGEEKMLTVPLYAGPAETQALENTARGMDRVKDYGIFTVLAQPIFWLLDQLYRLCGNWGWAIVLLTCLIKLALFPLAAKSYRSMAKMKLLAPRMQQLKEQHGEDKMKFQQAVMAMYKEEKVNPLGGCLPILMQIPIFMALYWVILGAVELRQAPWIFWIHDLSVKDPWYVLPVLMTVSMYVQTLLNPPAADPLQNKMMKIMPLVFSVFFFFFPSGLVLYWVVNNILSIVQQWWITRHTQQLPALKKT